MLTFWSLATICSFMYISSFFPPCFYLWKIPISWKQVSMLFLDSIEIYDIEVSEFECKKFFFLLFIKSYSISSSVREIVKCVVSNLLTRFCISSAKILSPLKAKCAFHLVWNELYCKWSSAFWQNIVGLLSKTALCSIC